MLPKSVFFHTVTVLQGRGRRRTGYFIHDAHRGIGPSASIGFDLVLSRSHEDIDEAKRNGLYVAPFRKVLDPETGDITYWPVEQ
jgi:hypothetical protein